jgi:hypothetical protein
MATNLGKMCHEEIYASTIALLATALAVGGVGLATDALARDGHPAAVAILTLMAAAVLTPSAVAPIPIRRSIIQSLMV